jgi:hypothetical protein
VTVTTRWIIAGTGAVLVLVLVIVVVVLPAARPARPAPAPSGFTGTATARPDGAWDQLFQGYGNLSGQWSGGDGAQSLLLPDGSTMWFFADTYLGQPAPDGTRTAASTGLAHNSAVLYRDGHLGPTYAQPPGFGGYNAATDYTWVDPPPPYSASRYELINGDQLIDDGTVYKFYQLADRDLHPGGFPYKLVGTVLESFSLDPATDQLTPAGGTPIEVEDTAGADPVIWGAATLVAGGYIYIYGTQPYRGGTAPFPLYLARVPVGGLAAGDSWQYYAGQPGCSPGAGTWTDDPRSVTAIRADVSSGFSVTDVDGTYVLLTNNTARASTTNDAVAYYADCPAGFAAAGPRYLIYRPGLPRGYLAYEYRIVPQFSSGSDVLISYSENTLQPDGNLDNAAIYRPRFLDVRLPGIAGPAGAITEPDPADGG